MENETVQNDVCVSVGNLSVHNTESGSEQENSKDLHKKIQAKWNEVVEKSKHVSDPWAKFSIEESKIELVKTKKLHLKEIAVDTEESTQKESLPHQYEAEWECNQAVVKMLGTAFAQGAMRQCYRMKKIPQLPDDAHVAHFHALDWKHASNYVAKRYMKDVPDEIYENDIKLQMEAAYWAKLYDLTNPPKKIDMINAYLVQFTEREGQPLFCVERYIEGEYIKHNSNSGYVDSDHDDHHHRMTPQAFSHFTYHKSGGRIMVVDIQGVGDLYTDPQIHSLAKGFGEGDLGARGMGLFFSTHRCSPLCELLGLEPFPLSQVEMRAIEEYDSTYQAATIQSNCSSQDAKNSPLPPPADMPVADMSVESHSSNSGLDGNDFPPPPPPPLGEANGDEVKGKKFAKGKASENEDQDQSSDTNQIESKDPSSALLVFDEVQKDPYCFGPIHLEIVKNQLQDPLVNGEDEEVSVLFHLSRAAQLGATPALEALANLYSGTLSDTLLPPNLSPAAFPEDPVRAHSLWEMAAETGSVRGICRMLVALPQDSCVIEKKVKFYEALIDISISDPESFEEHSSMRPYELKASLAQIYSGEDLSEEQKTLKNIEKARELYFEASEDAMGEMRMKTANDLMMKAESL